MNSQIKKTLLFLLVTVLLAHGMVSCTIDQSEDVTITNIQYYSIEPKTVLEAISQGKEDAFISISDEPSLASPSKGEMVSWDQADYIQIAEALHKLVWGESLKTWGLYQIYFSSGCDQIDIGFQYAQFKLYKIVTLNGRETRVEHFIEIDPSRTFAQAMETEYYPALASRKSIDLTAVKIFANEALQIADKNGGFEKRMAVKNECGISVDLSRDTAINDGWLVIYSPNVFIDEIDPGTGK